MPARLESCGRWVVRGVLAFFGRHRPSHRHGGLACEPALCGLCRLFDKRASGTITAGPSSAWPNGANLCRSSGSTAPTSGSAGSKGQGGRARLRVVADNRTAGLPRLKRDK
jgi:hypothetical protein